MRARAYHLHHSLIVHDFFNAFGLNIRIYDGRSFADDDAKLASIRKGDNKGGEFSPRRNTKIGNLEDKMMELFGLKVQISGSDDSYLCNDDLTIAGAYELDEKKMGKEILNRKDTIKEMGTIEADDYQLEFEILHQSCSDSVDNEIITFEQYDNAGAIMCALYPIEARAINLKDGFLDESSDLDDIGGIVFRDMHLRCSRKQGNVY